MTDRRYVIELLVGPCSEEEATDLMLELFEASRGRLGAVASLGLCDEEGEQT